MSCKYPEAKYYVGPDKDGKIVKSRSRLGNNLRGFCSQIKATKKCPKYYKYDGYSKIEWDEIKDRKKKFCIGDTVKSRRYVTRCVKDDWSNVSEENRMKCITGQIDGSKRPQSCGPEMCANTPQSDAFMINYCSKPQNWDKEECACLLPANQYDGIDTIGPVHCVYKPCARNPKAYKTQAQIDNSCTIQDIDCSIGDIYLDADNGKVNDVLIRQACSGVINGGDSTPDGGINEDINIESIWDGNNWVMLLILLVVLFGGGFFLIKNKKKKSDS